MSEETKPIDSQLDDIIKQLSEISAEFAKLGDPLQYEINNSLHLLWAARDSLVRRKPKKS